MNPHRFPGSNTVQYAPPGMENCSDLHCYKGQGVIMSAWKPTPEELVKINLGEFIWLTVWGDSMPPVSINATDPFQ